MASCSSLSSSGSTTPLSCLFSAPKHMQKPEFVSDRSHQSNYDCIICKEMIALPAVQMHCGHRACSTCIDSIKESDAPQKCCPGEDPECNEVDLQAGMYFPDYSFTKELGRMKVYCLNKQHGCQEMVAWCKFVEHSRKCEFAVTKCQYSPRGCPEEFPLNSLGQHESGCFYNICIPCPYCEEDIWKGEMINGHAEICKNKQYQCPLVEIGCSFVGENQQEFIQHSETNAFQHLALMKEWYKEMKHGFDENNKAVEDAMGKANYILINIEKMAKSLHDFNEKCDLRILKVQQLDSYYSDNVTDLQNLKKNFVEVDKMLAEIRGYESRLVAVENGYKNGVNLGRGTNSGIFINLHCESIEIHEAIANEFGAKVKGQGCSKDGMFIWKIIGYKRVKADARPGKVMSVFSPPFYTSMTGYKLCLQLYPNGDSTGHNTHVSVNVMIMPGEFDAIRVWPFTSKVTLSLMAQETHSQNLSSSLRPDAALMSYRGRVVEPRVACGFPQFAGQAQMECDAYIKNDTVFIKAEVQQFEEADD